MGYIIRNGVPYGGGGSTKQLSGLADVNISNPKDGEGLIYDANASEWTNGASGSVSRLLLDYDAVAMGGLTVTLSHVASAEGPTPESYTIVLDNTGEVEQDVINLGLWTITWTHEGQSYREEFDVHYYGYFHVILHEGFTWRLWATAGGIPINQYNSLSQLLADEAAVRRLFIVHDAVDYMCENANSTQNQDLITIINNGLCAKWANLNDYALDNMEADAVLSDLMDDADLYGYGELIEDNGSYVPKGNVPVMTSGTAPYGEAHATTYLTNYNPYKAFDGVPYTSGSQDAWVANGANSIIWFDFPTPVKANKIVFQANTSTSNNVIVASNNKGANYEEIKSFSDASTTAGEEQEIVFDNDDYYLSWGIKCSASGYGFFLLQFYGHTLKVSVPTMTSNTAPYGEVSSSAALYNTYNPYKAFDKSDSTGWYQISDNSASLTYDFSKPMLPRMVAVTNFLNQSNFYRISKFKVQGSNDNSTWTDLTEDVSISTTALSKAFADLNASVEYRYINILMTMDGVRTEGGVAEIQIYGKDYSEKEFANDGSKWLYDHGVELETIGYSIGTSGRAEDLGESLYSESNGTQNTNRSACYVNLDLTDYSLARVRGVRQAVQYATLGVFETPVVTTIAAAMANGSKDTPDALGLDITSINAQKYLSIHTDGNGAKFEVAEFWLE